MKREIFRLLHYVCKDIRLGYLYCRAICGYNWMNLRPINNHVCLQMIMIIRLLKCVNKECGKIALKTFYDF